MITIIKKYSKIINKQTEITKTKKEECVLAEAEAGFTEVVENKGFQVTVPPAVKTDFCEP